MTTKEFHEGDRVQHTNGPTGTVLKVYPDEAIAFVNWDEWDGPGQLRGKEWHVHFHNIEKIS